MKYLMLVVLLTGCTTLSSKRKLESQYYALYKFTDQAIKANKSLADKLQLANDRLKMEQVQLDVQHEQIKQAIEIQAKYSKYEKHKAH